MIQEKNHQRKTISEIRSVKYDQRIMTDPDLIACATGLGFGLIKL